MAVTKMPAINRLAACFCTNAGKWAQVGGIDQTFSMQWRFIAYCLRLYSLEKNLRNSATDNLPEPCCQIARSDLTGDTCSPAAPIGWLGPGRGVLLDEEGTPAALVVLTGQFANISLNRPGMSFLNSLGNSGLVFANKLDDIINAKVSLLNFALLSSTAWL
ncbi:hypothetical protein SGGMMB4_05291 [Sodalis glossinidius str. 'morsitans']|uniref:Uncharacterized protein n=1 Tax=Sodalis glossinidius (strain morsitans) TaxID=343509 RepID=A0A193QMV2_SODGM|nr:hypothetical protein SGGMMB4_05291 [Sodalis glossinidius str. 'morsitans']